MFHLAHQVTKFMVLDNGLHFPFVGASNALHSKHRHLRVVLPARLWFLLRLVTSMKTITVLLVRSCDIILMNSPLPINGRELIKAGPCSYSWTCLHFYLMEFTPIDFHCNQHDIDPASPWAKRPTVFREKKINEGPVLSLLRVWDVMWPPDAAGAPSTPGACSPAISATPPGLVAGGFTLGTRRCQCFSLLTVFGRSSSPSRCFRGGPLASRLAELWKGNVMA